MREIVNLLLAILPLAVFLLLIRWAITKLRNPTRMITDASGLKKISSNPSIFGGAWRKSYYFDEQNLYEAHKNSRSQIPFSDILESKPGYTVINNRRNWSVIFLAHGVEKQLQFYPNLTLFNHNFSAFLLAVKQANPQAKIKEIGFFNL